VSVLKASSPAIVGIGADVTPQPSVEGARNASLAFVGTYRQLWRDVTSTAVTIIGDEAWRMTGTDWNEGGQHASLTFRRSTVSVSLSLVGARLARDYETLVEMARMIDHRIAREPGGSASMTRNGWRRLDHVGPIVRC
jgi:hypothetical protein